MVSALGAPMRAVSRRHELPLSSQDVDHGQSEASAIAAPVRGNLSLPGKRVLHSPLGPIVRQCGSSASRLPILAHVAG